MTTTDLAAALLRDVPRYEPDNPLDSAPSMKDDPQGDWLSRDEVLAALTAALDGVDERAGEVLRDVTPEPWTLCRLADQTPHSIQASYGCINGLSALFTLAHINVPDEAVVGMTDGAFDRETADANARFIAWARNNVPALLAQNAALRAERDEPHWDDHCVNQFAKMMREKMALSRAKGRSGWNDPNQCSVEYLRNLLYEHLDKGDPVDVANFCMMLRHYDASTRRDYGNTLDMWKTRAEAAEAEVEKLRGALEKAEQDFYEAANRFQDEDYEGPHEKFTVNVVCHIKPYFDMHMKHLRDSAAAARAALSATTEES